MSWFSAVKTERFALPFSVPRTIVILWLFTVLFSLIATRAYAFSDVIEDTVTGEAFCDDLFGSAISLVVDSVSEGPQTAEIDGWLGYISIAAEVDEAGLSFTWSVQNSGAYVTGVLVGGEAETSVYSYSPFSLDSAGIPLHAPFYNGSYGVYDNISYVNFCFYAGLDASATADTVVENQAVWDIEKTSSLDNATLALGQVIDIEYTVEISRVSTDFLDYAVFGTVTVANRTPFEANGTAVNYTLSDLGLIDLSCAPFDFSTLHPSESVECVYRVPCPDEYARTGNVSVVVAGDNDTFVPTHAEVPVDFSGAPNKTVDACLYVEDTLFNMRNLVCPASPTKVITYRKQIGPYSVCGNYEVSSSVSFTTFDTETTGSANHTVYVNVPCADGCTLTLDYWRSRAGFTWNNADKISQYLPISLGSPGGIDTVVVADASKAHAVLGAVDASSSGVDRLMAYLLAAKLNIANGANGAVVLDTVAFADAFLAQNSRAWSNLSRSAQANIINWSSVLDAFNRGYTGPNSCSE